MLLFIYIHCKGLEQDFKFNGAGAGASKVTLKDMKESKIGDIGAMFSHIIQSGKDVVLDDHTLIMFYAFMPPVQYR